MGTQREVRERRALVAARYRPGSIELLLVAETPPADPEQYFYFENVRKHDSLFRYVVREILGVEPSRPDKTQHLERLRDRGVFLIDLKPDPVDETSLADFVPDLVRRCIVLAPRRIVLIKVTVYDAAFEVLRGARLPVVNERIPFPGSGQQRRFREAFRRALRERVT